MLDHILSSVGQETGADSMMDAALWALIHALGAEGAAVIGSLSETAPTEVLHECGPGASAILQSPRVCWRAGREPAMPRARMGGSSW